MGIPYHKIEFKNQTYKLRLNSKAIWILDKEHNFRFSKIDQNNFEIPEIILIIYVSLLDFHEDKATIDFASEILDELRVTKGAELVSKLMIDYWPQAEEGEAEVEVEKKTEEFGSPPGTSY